MNRYVIKGRGEHRGKYLCYARMAPDQKPTKDGFVWLPEQRKAARWEDPRYSGQTWATDRAALHNGYFVRLTAPKAIIERVPDLRAYIDAHASGADEELDCYWIHGANEKAALEAAHALDYTDWNADLDGEGTNFCGDCVDEVIDVLRALIRAKRPTKDTSDEDDDCDVERDGGWNIEHDSPPSCAKCGAKLSGNLTEHGAAEELNVLTDHATPDFDEPNGWRDFDNAIVNLPYDHPRWRKIAKVVDEACKAETRCAFLALLAARQEQKAPEPLGAGFVHGLRRDR